MANYLPVLLVSVTAGMPDDAALKPLPRGQVDYLSHDWAEEDVWRSWRNMTKQKNEIANGVRLENASWRTWMKQRNKLKTISPETLNWLKDSDVTWLYGPLHTAVDWAPPKPAISPPTVQHAKDDSSAPAPKSPGANSLSSPSSSVALDRFNQPVGRYALPPHEGSAMKPILKHRSIAEMLTSALPPAPSWAEESSEFQVEREDDTEEDSAGAESRLSHDRRDSASAGRGGRPPLFHTKSDTNIVTRFGRGGTRKRARVSPARVGDVLMEHEPESPFHSSLSASQRTGASNNLAEMAGNASGVQSYSNSRQSSSSPFRSSLPLENTESSGTGTFANDAASIGRADSDSSGVSPAVSIAPQKKHISFNAIVEQCIAIDGGSAPMTPSTHGLPWTTYGDDGDLALTTSFFYVSGSDPGLDVGSRRYTQDVEDGMFEDISMGMHGDTDSDDACVDDDEDDILEIKPPSRRSSSGSLQDYRVTIDPQVRAQQSSAYPCRPQFRRSSTGSSRLRKNVSTGSGSGSGSGSTSGQTSESGRSRSSVALDREHVTIAPIAPTILKAGGAEEEEDGVLYMGGAPHSGYSEAQKVIYGSGAYSPSLRSGFGGSYSGGGGTYGYGYGYGGYGYGECVSAGRDDAFEHFERGTEAGELVYQSPNGNVYPWGEGDAARFRMQTEFGLPGQGGSPPRGYGLESPRQSPTRQMYSADLPSTSSSVSDSTAKFTSGSFVKEPSPEELVDEQEFEYFDDAEGPYGVDSVETERLMDSIGQERELRSGRQPSDDAVRMNVPYLQGHPESADQRGPEISRSLSARERTPSPDFQPKVNPRIASLKSESGYRSPPPPSPSLSGSDITASLVPSSPTMAIPTPGISPAHEQDFARMRSPPESPIMQAGLLSPPEMSPRGRSICVSPSSGSAASSSVPRSGSRSVSESRSESRGRSRTRNSSLASSPDQAEPERGRSRSRSIASSANSPLGESSSPHARCPSLAIGGIGVGLGIGSGFGVPHGGREVRDGRGVRLYRKTSEDFIHANSDPKGVHLESRVAHSHASRGRNREGKRVSESLSPPVLGSIPPDRRSAVSPPSATYRPIPSSGLKHRSIYSQAESSRRDSSQNGLDKNVLQSSATIARTSEGSLSLVSRRSNLSRSVSREHSDSASSDCSSPFFGSGSPTVTGNGRTLPASIPEEDEQRLRSTSSSQVHSQLEGQKPGQTTRSSLSLPVPTTSDNVVVGSSSRDPDVARVSSPVERSLTSENTAPPQTSGGGTRTSTTCDSASDSPNKTFVDRTAELVSSARSLLGTIWNSS